MYTGTAAVRADPPPASAAACVPQSWVIEISSRPTSLSLLTPRTAWNRKTTVAGTATADTTSPRPDRVSVHVAALWNISDVVEEVEEDPDEGVCVFFPTSQSPPVPVFLDEKSTKSVYVVRAVPPVAYLRKAAREKEIATMRVSRSAVHQVAGITFLRGSV